MSHPDQRWPVGGDDIAYGQATGRLRIVESRLLKRSELEAAIRREDLSAWAQLLDQLEYPENNDLMVRIAHARQEADGLLVELSAHKSLSYGLLLYQSYHNLKVFLKALLPASGKSSASVQIGSGSGIPENLSDLLFWGSLEAPRALWDLVVHVLNGGNVPDLPAAEEYELWKPEDTGMNELGPQSYLRTGIPPVFAAAIRAAADVYAATEEVGRIDSVLDAYYFAHLSALAKQSRLPFLKTYAGLRADIANLNTLYRAKRLQLDEEGLAAFWVPGGQVDRESFLRLLEADLSSWQQAFEQTPVVELVELAYRLSHPQEGDEETRSFTKAADNLVLDLARTGLHVIYGPQVVAGFWLARQTEAQNLRLALSLQAQGKSTEELLELLREVYIGG